MVNGYVKIVRGKSSKLMTPSKKQIDLSKRLWELGVRKEVEAGDYVWFDNDLWLVRINASNQGGESIAYINEYYGWKSSEKLIPIWTLEDGLEWLFQHDIYLAKISTPEKGEWRVSFNHTHNYEIVMRGKLTEAVLSACVKVAENELG